MVPEEDEKEPDDHEALAGPEHERPLEHVDTRIADLAFESRETGRHLLAKLREVVLGRHFTANGFYFELRGAQFLSGRHPLVEGRDVLAQRGHLLPHAGD